MMEKPAQIGLIVTADDMGLCPERDEGILKAHQSGLVTSASLFATGSNSETAARLAKSAGLPLVLHLNLTEGPPASLPSEVPSLLCLCKSWWPGPGDGTERLEFRGKMGLRDALIR
jgi:hypothetical protein